MTAFCIIMALAAQLVKNMCEHGNVNVTCYLTLELKCHQQLQRLHQVKQQSRAPGRTWSTGCVLHDNGDLHPGGFLRKQIAGGMCCLVLLPTLFFPQYSNKCLGFFSGRAVLAVLLLMLLRVLEAFLAARACCWLMLSLLLTNSLKSLFLSFFSFLGAMI